MYVLYKGVLKLKEKCTVYNCTHQNVVGLKKCRMKYIFKKLVCSWVTIVKPSPNAPETP